MTGRIFQFYVEAEGHKTLVTQIFDRESNFLEDDAVFAVKVRGDPPLCSL